MATLLVACGGQGAASTTAPVGTAAAAIALTPTVVGSVAPVAPTVAPTVPAAPLTATMPPATATGAAAPQAAGSTPSPPASPAASPTMAVAAATPTAAPAPSATATPPARSLLATTRLVTYYGNPLSAQMGILGELSKEQLVARLRQVAAEYEQTGGRPVKPAIHMVATVAQRARGADGMARARMAPELIQEYADLAAANDMLFFIDIQIGHSTWAAEIEAMRPFLSQPHVHLAMDPEFDMDPGETPGEHFGSTAAADINHAIRYLAGLVREHNLPPKVLIVHQFTPDMIGNKAAIEDDPLVDVVIMMDGFGGQEAKISKYHAFIRDQLVEFGGLKLFYRQDAPVMTPQQVVGLEPSPMVVTYQ